MKSIQILPAAYYHTIFENNLSICGVEDRLPQLVGSDVDFKNFNDQLDILGL